MMSRTYWLDLFTGETWKEFQEHGSSISGFRESRWTTVKRMKAGDYLLCYLIRVMRWVGVLEIIDKPFKSAEPQIWSREDFPCRIKVKPIILLPPEEGVPLKSLKDKLSYFKAMATPNSWIGHFRGSPVKEKVEDAELIIKALKAAKEKPITRLVDPKILYPDTRTYVTKSGPVTIPEDTYAEEKSQEVSHEEIQWFLLKMGEGLGLDLWVAKNDRNKQFKGEKRLVLEVKDIDTGEVEVIE